MAHRHAVLLALVVALSAGCATLGGSPSTTPPATFERCAHPYPCGDEWPAGLVGPFEKLDVAPLPLKGHDGIAIEAYAHLPKLADGVKAPVVLMVTPYPGTCASNSLNCAPRGDDPKTTTRIDTDLLVERGYAVVLANVRGTGNSGGCFEMGGASEQKDMVALVEQLAAEDWSNGRVGVIGHSYPSYTAWMAAVQAPPSLKTVVVSGFMVDLYTIYHTPQGAAWALGGEFQASYASSLGLVPPLGSRDPAHIVEHLAVAPERACPDVAKTTSETARSAFVDDRDEGFWTARSLVAGIPNATAAVLGVSGFEDSSGLFHAFQDDEVWRLLTHAPKRYVYGHWGHSLPPPAEGIESAPFGGDWYDDTLVPWLDFWLKGIGEEAPRLGVVDYADELGAWRASAAWPPLEARSEALYLADGALGGEPGGLATSLLLAPGAGAYPTCSTSAHVFETAPVEAPVTFAGNPFAYLRFSSDRPGGIVSVDLYDLAPEFECAAATGASDTGGWTWLAGGAADLRFHAGNTDGKDFPTGAPTMVRVDLNNQAWTIEPGHRLAVAISSEGYMTRAGQPYSPNVVILAEGGAEASHLVLPVVDGTFGGAATTLAYPPKPFW